MQGMIKEKSYSRWYGMLFSLLGWVIVAFATAGLFLMAIVFVWAPSRFLGPKTLRGMHTVAGIWARSIIVSMGAFWGLKVEGQEHIKPGQAYVIVGNHQSILDILAALAGIPAHFKFVAKKEIFAIPFMGWHMFFSGYISLNRGNRESARKTVDKARSWLKRGVSVLFFPEGTRSIDGQMQEFKAGAFKLAIEENLPILPVVIEGTGEAAPKHCWYLQKRTLMKVNIGVPVFPAGKETESVDQLRNRVRREMSDRLARIRAQK